MSFIRGTIKNAPWVVIAVVLHVVAIAALSIIYVTSHKEAEEENRTSVSIGKTKELDKEPEVTVVEVVDRTAIPKAKNVDALLEAGDDITADAPSMSDDSSSASSDEGDSGADSPSSRDFSGGTSLGVGPGGGHHGSGKPSAFVSRKLGSNTGLGARKGATAKTEKAVLDGLVWLVRHQQADGSWSAARLHEICDKDGPGCDGDLKGAEPPTAKYDEGLTGLSLLAFLGYGADHTYKTRVKDNRGKETRLGEVVKNALLWLIKRQDSHKDGRFSDTGEIYNEALATLAMCEAYGMTRYEKWKGPAQRGVDFLVAAQRLSPTGTGLWGWRYEPRTWIESAEGKASFTEEKEWRKAQFESDLSATAWVVMALKSAELAELNVPETTMQGAMAFTKWVTVKDGRVAYMDPLQVGRKPTGEGYEYDFHETTMGALGMCVRTFIEKDIDDPVLELSAQRIVKDLPAVSKNKLSVDYYYWYYGTLALNQLDGPDNPKRSGKFWKNWNTALTDALLPLQVPAEKPAPKTCIEGSWPTPDRWSGGGGPIYRTSINILTLECYYRYDNVFGTAAMKKRELPKDDKKEEKKEDLKK